MNKKSPPHRVLVTGASRGIGFAIAARFRQDQWEVVTPSRADLDLSKRESVLRFIESGGTDVDVLINNAGENKIGPLAQVDLADWDRIIETNLSGPMLLLRAAAEKMRLRKWGRIINVSSCYSLVSRANRGPYASSKAGLNGLTRTAALEYAKEGVLINSVCPGFVETELTRKNNNPEQIAALTSMIPLGRLAQAEEIAELVFFLGSERNTYITGQSIVSDGGFLIT